MGNPFLKKVPANTMARVSAGCAFHAVGAPFHATFVMTNKLITIVSGRAACFVEYVHTSSRLARTSVVIVVLPRHAVLAVGTGKAEMAAATALRWRRTMLINSED